MGVITVQTLADAIVGLGEVGLVGSRGLEARAPASVMPQLAERLQALGAEVQLVAGIDSRADTGNFTLAYVLAPAGGAPHATVLVPVPASAPRFPSIATTSFAASRFEREIADLLGLEPIDHPDPRRLALHQFWPEGYHPLRTDVAPRGDVVDDGRPFPFQRVEGDGVFEVTVGPVHAGIIEPGHFRFSVEGETIVNLETRLGFVHKGTEKLFETLPFDRTWALAERVSGDSTVAHALAYCQALEALAGVVVPARAAWLRVVLLELERLYNHVGDVAMIVNDTGFAFGHAHGFRLREELLRLNERATGHRLLRGAVVPGGVTGAIVEAPLNELTHRVASIVREFLDIARLCFENTLVLERLQGTGRLTVDTARAMQVVGLVGRASGLDADARRDAPFAAYGDLDVRVAVRDTGDVWARTVVRIDEVAEAARLIEMAARRAGSGASAVPLGRLRAGASAVSVVEGWRGPSWYYVLARDESSVARVKLADPSFRNWPALERAVLKNIVPDFPLCNKSFNLSYSGNDA
jgi:Ni,Fe-hydrogenase III large subunit/Ni,Fe-hydrogenase III component G